MPTLHLKLKLACVITVVCCFSAHARQTITGKVVSIAEGDMLTVLIGNKQQHRIRLHGIDAPERTQAFGTRARQRLSELVFGKQVVVQLDKLARYGSSVGKVMIDGRDINLEMIRAGLAWHYKQYENEQAAEDRRLYAQAELDAREARRGLWADTSPVPPWEFRRGGRTEKPPEPVANRQTVPIAVADPALLPPAIKSTAPIIGNRKSKIYYRPDCPNYSDVAPQNRELFSTPAEAEKAGYKVAKNCP